MATRDKIDELYDDLKSMGAVSKSRENFRAKMLAPGKEGYKNRKMLFDAMKADGLDAGNDYGEFSQRIGLHAVAPKKQADRPARVEIAPQPQEEKSTAEQSKREEKPLTPLQRAAFAGAAGDIAAQAMRPVKRFDAKIENIKKGTRFGGPVSERKLNPETGKWEKKYYTATGEEVSTPLEQAEKNAKSREEWETTTPEGRESRQRRIENAYEERVGDVMRKYDPDNAAEAAWRQAEQREQEAVNKHNDAIWRGFGGGREMRMVNTGLAAYSNMVDHLKSHDLQRMADDAWNRLGKKKQEEITTDLYGMLRNRYPDADDEALKKAAASMARQQSDRRMFELAVEKNAPKSATDFFFRKAIGQNAVVKLTEALARSSAGTTGDMEARDVAENRFDKGVKNKAAGIAGTVAGFAFDPLTVLSAGVGSGAVKAATWLGGKALGAAATRKAASTLGGRMVAGALGGAANFGTYEAGNEALDQLRWGGKLDVDKETGRYKVGSYSPSTIAKQFGHGLLMGGSTGVIAPMLGNVSDKLVRATGSTAGKLGVRAGELGVGTLAEGTIFSAPSFVSTYNDYAKEIESLSDKDSPNYIADEEKRAQMIEQLRKSRGEAMMDVWTDNMAMMAGFKGQSLIKSVPRRIAELSHNPRSKAGFETRLRASLDGRDGLALTKDEKRELSEGGYGDLNEFVEGAQNHMKNRKAEAEARDANGDSRYEEVSPDTPEGVVKGSEALPLGRFAELMNDGNISEAARAKMYYYLTGNALPMSTVMGGSLNEVKDADGKVGGYNVQSLGANGVITSRTFDTRERADREMERINRQAELNGFDVGERYYDRKGDDWRMRDACEAVSRDSGAPANMLFELMQRKPEEMNDVEQQWAGKILNAYDELGDKYSSSEVRSEINEQYGVDVDKAIGKERNRRSENEQEAVEDYAQRLFAGVKRGEEAGAEAERPSAAADVPPALPGGGGGDDHAEPQRDPISEAFERGRNADVQERRDIAIELGADDQNSEAHAERQGAWNGVVQRINEDADYIAAQQRERGKRMMGADGALHPATLKEKDEDGKDKTVYIVEGNVNMMADGSMVDPETSDSSVIVYDPETGERKMIAPTADTGLLSVGEVVSGEDFNAGIEQQKRDYIQAQIDEAQGTVRVAPGQNIVLPTGEQALVVAVGEDGESITVQLADGRQAQVARGDLQRVADEAAVADYKKRHGTETEPEEEPAEAENVEAAEAESPQGVAPHYEMNDEVVVRDGEGNPVKGTIQAVDNLAGTVEVATETPIDGKVVNVFPKAEFESMLERVGAEAEEEPQSESGATEQHEEIGKRIDGAPVDYTEGIELSVRDDDGNERPATVTGRVRFENGRFVPDANGSIVEFVEDGDVKHEHINNLNERVASYMPAKSSEEPVEEELPKEEEQPKEERPKEEEQPLQAEEQPLPSEEAAKQEEPMPMGKDGEEDWGAATPERARRYIYNEAGLSRSEGNEFVKARMKAARETLAKTQAAPMPKMGTSIKKYNEAKAKRQAKIEEAQKAVDYWQQVSSAQNEIYRAEEAKREAEENARRQALAQKSDGTLNGVPEWEDDTPQDARARGYRRVAAVKYDRQEPVAAVKGKEVEVKFTDRVKQKGDVALVDADSLQPSHINGQRNPAFFLDEAQPKERTDQASLLAAEDMARHINPEEITGSVTAYSGAPVVNSRGEVIQGNNRSAALKLMWRDNAPQAEKYKQYLKDHAADFGLTAEEVDGMAHPVLVNMADVDDGKAIELGQYDVKDTETGGTERIKAKNTMQKMREGGDMSSFANILLKSEDAEQSFSGLVDDNGAELLRWMQMKKYITPTQYGSAFDSRGNITAEAKNDLKSIMYQSIFRGGSTQLEEMFNRMPVKAQRAILATAFRDYDSPADERMVEELQASIRAYNALMEEPAFADAKNFEDAQRGVALWSRQTHMDFATGESYVPADNFSNFALYLAAMYKGANQGYMQGVFNRLYDLIQGKQEPDLFNPNPDNTPRTLAQAIKEVLNIDYNGKLGRNAVSDMAGYGGKDRERGGDGEPPRGGTAAEGDGTSEPASSTGESGSTKGTAPGVQGEVRGGDELHEPDERGGRETENSSRRQPSDLAQSGENGTGTASSRGDAGARQSATGAGGQGNAPAEEREGRGGASEQNTLPEKNTVGTFDPRSMTDVEKERRGEMLRDAEAVEVGKEIITSTPEMSARKAAEKWWDENVGEPALYDTEAGEVEINRNSVESSLAHRYSQMKLDAVTSLVDGFGNAVYLGTMPDSRERGVLDHYFAYPIIYGGKRCYVFCRAMQDANKNRLYVHEVFVADKIKKGNTLQTAASKPHGGIALYRDILANVLTEGDAVWRTPKDATASSAEKQGLDYARPENAEDGTKGSGITPQSTPSVGKSNEKSESAQEKVVENAGSSPIGTASSAEKVDVERQGVNTKPIEKQAKGEGGLPRTATGEDAHGNRRKIEDFGKKLGGAKKDKALDCIENLRKKSEKDIGALSKADDILSRKEILRLVSEDKMDEQSGRGLLSFNEAINPLVRVSKSMQDGDAFKTALLNRYAWHVKTWEASHDEPLSIDADAEAKFIEQATEGLNNSNRRYVASMLREWLPAIYHTYEVVGGEGRGILPYVVRPNGLSGGYWVMKPGSKKGFGLSTAARAFAKLRELCPIKEAALSDQKKIGEKNQDDVLHVVEANGRYRIKSRRVHGDVYFSGDFYSRKEADAYLKAHKDDLAAAEASYAANLGMKSVLSVEREGVDYRGGRDVSENEFLQTFGFRGVEFGNWVSDKERQPYLNTTYDALMDLAAIIDLSPKALSLGGRLGLSFGARGGGNASAHYESDHEVINLTRTKGVGSLAHEWFHAVDNYLARSKSGNMSDYGTEERGKIDGMRADLSKSFSELVDAIKSSDFHTRSLRAGKYWSRTIEEAARAFSLYVEDKLEAKSSRSPMLTRAVADNIEGQTEAEKAAIDEALKTFPYPTVSERISIDKAFDKFFDTLQEKTDPMGNVVLFHRTASTEASPVTKEQQAMVQGMAEWLRGAGIEVNTDETEGQRVLDMARSNDETLREESRRHHGAKAEERNRILNTIDEANSFVRGTTRKQERKRRLAEEKVIKENTKKLYDAVLSGNFNDVTLRLINDYLEHVTPYNPYRQPVSRRLPERVQRSLRGGKQTNCIDALFTRISESAVGASGKTVAERRRVVKAKKEELLEGWAKATGHWHTDVSDFTNEKEPLGKGKDSDVYLSKDGKSVIKVSKGKDEGRKFSSDPDAIVLYNAVFPSTRYKILGYGRIGGQFVRFLEQPIVEFKDNASISVDDRTAYMERLGFRPLNKDKTSFSNGELIVTDVQKGNIVRDKDGNVRVIDADVKLHTKDIGGEYTYPAVEADTGNGDLREMRVYHGSGADFFNEKDLKMQDKVRLFRTPNGEALGFMVGGKIYLDPRKATPETPIHEYGHIWLEALKQGNRQEYDSLMQKVRDEAKLTPIWEEIRKNYPDLSEEEMAEEVFVMYSGRKGSRRIDEEVRRTAAAEGQSPIDKAATISALERLKQAIRDVWKGILNFLHIHYKTVDEAVEQQLKDFVMQNNPREALRMSRGEETAEERSIVERAKQDGTYMKAPNGEPTKLTERQWVQVRTKAFKNWFGDWEKAARIEKLKHSKSVDVKYDNEYSLTAKDALSWIKNNLRGEYRIDDTGETVQISKVGAKEVTSHSRTDEAHLKSISAIPDMLKHAIFIDEMPNAKGNSKFDSYRYYAVGLNIDGVPYTAKIVIGVKQGKKYYDHRLTQLEKTRLIDEINQSARDFTSEGNASIPPYVEAKDTRLISLLQTNSSKIVDENGEPRVVYHGTTRDEEKRVWNENGGYYDTSHDQFTVFRRDVDGERNSGMFFNSDPDNAYGYGYYSYDTYLKLRNPLVIDCNGSNYSAIKYNGEEKDTYGWCDYAEKHGYDGVVFNNIRDGVDYGSMQTPTNDYVAFKSNQIKSATDNIGTFSDANPDIRYQLAGDMGSEEDIEAVNKRFNDELQGYTPANADSKVFDLGRPSAALLSGGVVDKPMKLYGSKIAKKIKKHGLDVEDLKDLPRAVAAPIAIFNNYEKEGNRSVLTELHTRGGNILVSLNIGKGMDVDFNIVSSMFGKGNDKVLNWLEKGYATYINKKKALDYLHLSAPIAEASDNSKLLSAATKVVKEFENPAVEGAESADDNTLYRESDDVEAVGRRFDDDIEKYQKKELPQGYRFELGYPSALLRSAGFENLPISMRASLLARKAGDERHPFEASDLKGLVNAIQKPIAIFRYSKGNMRNLIVDTQRNGKHFLVGVTLNYKANGIEINSVSGLFPKENHEWIKWIQDGKAIRIDQKEKVQRLIDSLRTNPAESDRIGLDIDSVAKVVKEFENPAVEGAESADDNTLYRESDDVEAVNERFNEELQGQIEGTQEKGHVYRLGRPSAILRSTGFPDVPIEFSATRLAEKAAQRNHEFDISDVRDLVMALQHPLAVFAYGNKDKAQNAIVEIQRDGKNFVVGVHFNQERRGLVVSDIRGLFPKDNAEWLNWINQGKLLYVDKEKIQTLIDQQRTNLAEVDYLNLDSVAKVVKEFENPAIDGAESADDNTLYRESDDVEAVNEKFNDRLSELVANPLQKDRVLHLGNAGAFLRNGGVRNAEIVLEYDKLARKSKESYKNQHPFNVQDIKDLPKAINSPIAVFDNTNDMDNGKVILTELKKDGHNFIVVVKAKEQHRKGGVILEVNDIATLFPKDARGIVNWFNTGKATNIDKEKALGFIEALQNHPETSIKAEELSAATKVVKEFENPAVEGAESADDNALYRTSDEIDAEYPNWLDGTTTDSGKHSTQVAGTRKTYGHVGDWIEKHLDKGVRILDASSGMGLGTKDLRERSFNIEDVEPYQSEERKRKNPATYSSYDQVEGKYDYIISNAVLNVIPDDWRRDVLHDMADRLKTGGHMFINTRKAGEEKTIKDKIELDSPQEVLVKRNGRIASYQRFFTPEELRDYVARELGEGYKVEIADEKNSGTKGLAAVVVTKERDAGMESAVAKRETAKLLSAKLNTPIHIVEDVNEIEHPDPEAQMQRRRAKGWYDTSTGEVVVVLPNNSDVEDVAATIAHETIAHKGLRELVGEDRYDEFLDEVHDHLDAELKKEVDDEAGRNFMDDAMENGEKSQSYEEHRRRAMDELFGRLAEKPFEEMGGKERTLWQRLKEAVRRLLDKFLGTLKLPKWFKIGDNELRYMLWRSKERLERGKEDPIDFARDIVKREELGLDDAVYSMGDSPETFKARQKRAVEEKGVVMPGLNEAEVKVVDVPRHDFTGTAKEALKSAEKWAKENIVGVHKATANDGTSFEYEIANKSVEKYVSSSSTQKSDNIGIHLSVLKELPEVISHSIEAEEHPDYAKDATGIRNVDNSINSSAMIHRFYGAVRIDGKIYRVKTTIREYEDANRGNRAHSYEVTKIELVEAPSTGGTKASGEPLAMTSTNSISAAKLLQNVEKAYDKGKKLLGESRRIDMRVGKDREKKALQEKPLLWGKRDVFSSAQRIVNGENGKLLFRDKIEDTDDTAREMYNRMADEKRNIVREAWQDSMINVRNLQEAVLKQTGGQIADNEDAYLQENNMHGRARAEQEDFERNYYEPLIVEVNAVAKKAGNSIGDVVAYMKAKHGLERNEVFARRDAKAAYEQLKKKNPDATETEDDFYLKFRERDYSGLTALTGKENVVDAEVEAQRIVDAMEAKADTKELWARVNAATKKTLEKAYDSGMVSKENYEQVRDMFDYYIPLRGFTEKTAEDVYDYIDGDRGTRFSPTIYKAKGRSSESDDPIAYIGQMASSAIVQGEKNLVKRALLNFARNHPTNLITVSEMWYRNYGTKDNPDWREDVPNIPEDADGDEVAEIVRQHEADMEQLAKDGLATKKRGRLHLGMPVNKANAREHHVEVMVNGKKYVLYINGNPRAAQALNGSRTQRASEREVGILERALGKINRGLAQRYTSLSPSFTVGNAFRDLTMAFAMTNIKEGPDYARRFMANMALLGGPVRMFPLMHRYRAGKINMSNETERLFYEFMTRGGETGFTSLKEIDDYKRDMERVYKNANRSVVDPRRVWNDLTDAVELTNRCIEDMTRFATYMTSRKGGKSIDRSVEDAKNITLNFNRKGTGELGNATARHLFVFVNPAIQALETIASAAKHHPVRLSVTGGLIGVIGFAQPLITAVLASAFNDDEEWDPMSEYWKLPEWQRRNNYVVWIPGTRKFAMIPLGQEFRVIHGFGETVSSIKAGKNSDDALLDVASQAADLLPLSPDGNGGNPLITFAPTTVQPLMQVGFNTDFTGRPIYKNSDWNKYEPAYQKAYIGTPEWLVRTSAGMNELTGGNAHRQGRLERTKLGEYANNPAVVNHLLKGYLGGLYSFGAQLAGSVVKAANHEAPDVQEMPIVNRVITAPREMEQSGKVRLGDDYYRIKEDHDRIGTELSGWKRDAKRGDENALKEIERMVGDSAVARYKSEGEYLRAIGQVRTAIDYTQDETRKAKLRTLLQRLQDRMSEEFK